MRRGLRPNLSLGSVSPGLKALFDYYYYYYFIYLFNHNKQLKQNTIQGKIKNYKTKQKQQSKT